mgnify:CR=1 FL=1
MLAEGMFEKGVSRIGCEQEMFLVEGDAKVPYEAVARGMALLQSAGVQKIGFVTTPPSPAQQKKR